jgi:hypothetical protein
MHWAECRAKSAISGAGGHANPDSGRDNRYPKCNRSIQQRPRRYCDSFANGDAETFNHIHSDCNRDGLAGCNPEACLDTVAG